MSMNRRRFLCISAAMAATPAWSVTHSWQGRALGADVSLKIKGPREVAILALQQVQRQLIEIERLFSLHDPSSALVELNRTGSLSNPDVRFTQLMQAADVAHIATDGLFDPTIQPLWRALASDGDTDAASAVIGWDRVLFDPGHIQLDQGQALTFNGIAQGFATDLVTAQLAVLGLTDTLVNIGEYRALGGPWRLGISDPTHGRLGMRTLDGNAIATSSPAAMLLGDHAHILHRDITPRWSTVSVEAVTATLADGLSTALCLAPRDIIDAVRAQSGVQRITLVDFEGNLSSL